jgi:tetratricopeptide (TPR) repeat protein
VPDVGPLPPLEDLGQIGAVRLYVERVRAVNPDFVLSEANAPAVVAIVRRLDGLPLALELAAARVRALSLTALLARLERSLPLLTGGAQDLPVRQRTLRETIAWSYDLLRPHEQILFRRLGVFAGGCTLDAAETVANLDESLEVLEGMDALLDASLLQAEAQDDPPRYTMLATIREFALERLMESGEESETRERHARVFLRLLERHDPEYADPAWLDVIDREYDNLRAALGWSRDTDDHDTLLRLAGSLVLFWYYRRHLNEGRRWLNQALETPPDHGVPRPRAWVLTWSGMLANVAGETDHAAAVLIESFPWWERTGDAYGQMMARSLLGGVRVSQGRYDEAAALFGASEAYLRANETALMAAGHGDWPAHARFHLGLIAWVQGDDTRARRLLRESVEIWDRSSAPVDAVDPLRYLGLLACAAGDLDEAALWFRDELSRLRQHGSRAAIAIGLADVATFAAARESWQIAARLFAKAEALVQAEGAAFSLPARDHYVRAHDRARQALGESAYQASTAAGQALTLEQGLAEAEAVLDLDHNGGASFNRLL